MYKSKEEDINLIEQKHLVLPEEITLKYLVYKYIHDANYRELIVSTYDERIYDEKNISVILKCLNIYNTKYNSVPSYDTLSLIINRYSERHEIELKSVLIELEQIKNLKIEDECIIKDSIIDLITSRKTYNAIIDNFETIKTRKDISKLQEELLKILNVTLDNDLGMMYFEHIQSHLTELASPELRQETGYNKLDYIMNGGTYSNGRCLILFLAATHVGKSLIMSNLAVNGLMRNRFVVIISLEMSEFVYATRIDAHISELGINSLSENVEELGARITQFGSLYPDALLAIKEFAPNSINCNNIRAYCEKLQKKYNRDIDEIYIDYLSLLNPIYGLNAPKHERVGSVSIETRALSYYFSCPVFSAAQSNRSGYGGVEIGMENISDSIAVPMNADCLFTLYQLDGDREMGILRSKVEKNRLGGKIGEIIEYHIDYNNLRIYDRSNDNTFISKEADDLVNELSEDLINTL